MHAAKTAIAIAVAGTFSLAASSFAHAQTIEDISIDNGSRTVPATVVIPDGEGPFPAVVMNHGHGGGRQEGGGFARLANALAEAGILTIRMDFPGNGDSTEPFTEGYLSNMISDSNASLDYILDNYPVDAEQLGIFGYSMGGRIALTIAGTPDQPYKAVALLAPSANWGEELLQGFFGGPDEYARLYAEASTDKGYADFTTQYGQQQQLGKTWFDELIASKPLDAIAAYTGAMLVVYGDVDTVVPPDVSKAVATAYPSASLVEVTEADHGYGFYSDQPDVTALVDGSITDFFVQTLK